MQRARARETDHTSQQQHGNGCNHSPRQSIFLPLSQSLPTSLAVSSHFPLKLNHCVIIQFETSIVVDTVRLTIITDEQLLGSAIEILLVVIIFVVVVIVIIIIKITVISERAPIIVSDRTPPRSRLELHLGQSTRERILLPIGQARLLESSSRLG